MIAEQIQQIELNIQQAEEFVERGNTLRRLTENPDFIAIIRKGYLETEAIRLVHLRASPSRNSKESQDEIMKEIDGIGSLLGYFRAIEHSSAMAQQAIEADKETLTELEVEQAQGGTL